MAKHRSARGSFVAKTREAIHFVFRSFQLPPFPCSTTVSESETIEWKKNPIVKVCHNKLYKKINPNGTETYMTKIIDRLFKGEKKKTSKVLIAFAISICEKLLNPDNRILSINEEVIKDSLSKNIVSF